MRKITNQEYLVLKSMLGHSSFLKSCNLDRFLQSILVEDMDDGGMGSLKILHKECIERKHLSILTEADFIDEDGINAIISIIKNSSGDIIEIDIQKDNFSPLLSWPDPKDLRFNIIPTAEIADSLGIFTGCKS